MKRLVHDPKDTANIFIIFLASLGKTIYRNGNPFSESFYLSVTSQEMWTLIGSFSVRKSSVPYSLPLTILKSIRDCKSSHRNVLLMLLSPVAISLTN